jgi:hypothetical protein
LRELGPGEIAIIVASLAMIVVWFGALKDARGWNRFQKQKREDRERREAGEPPRVEDDPNRPRGPWG